MSITQMGTKRDFEQEAEFQIELLQQKAREDFLLSFSQSEDTLTEIVEEFIVPTVKAPQREETEAKSYISSASKSILEKWMYEHRLYCYPTKAEKQALARETGLTVQKISNWFINSRRRMLPKMLQTEGRNPINFTISRKKKKTEAILTGSFEGASSSASYLSNCAIVEESKIIDQTSILYGNAIDIQNEQSNISYDRALQEFIVPYTETDDENSIPSELTSTDQHKVDEVIRGILYDQTTQSKCLFILINSPMK
ncbi:homeobox protein TGIF2LX-like [Contarinia nasturtii]|uniref:homeobox protein TGIF2LX-like n=1 Tax=Contarinia nasturtii TaxID=265458 RepID=UPI0012D3C4B4|nr:homeobox protein TGIF2LX-like [Contarinia nasturtii]